MQFNLTQQEAVTVIELLGKLPNNSGMYPTFVKLLGQYEAHVKQAAQPTPETQETQNG